MACNCNGNAATSKEKENNVNLDQVKEILKTYDAESSNLITLLQQVQGAYGFLPESALKLMAKETGIKEAKIYGVATFYSQFRMKPVGKYLIMLCQGTACHVNGSAKIEMAIRDFLGVDEGETTEDGLFTFINVACLGCCSLAPVMMINDQTYAKLTPKKVGVILNGLRNEEVAKKAI